MQLCTEGNSLFLNIYIYKLNGLMNNFKKIKDAYNESYLCNQYYTINGIFKFSINKFQIIHVKASLSHVIN